MLYGVRRDLQDRLRQQGYNMRVYIPFGTQWYPYLCGGWRSDPPTSPSFWET